MLLEYQYGVGPGGVLLFGFEGNTVVIKRRREVENKLRKKSRKDSNRTGFEGFDGAASATLTNVLALV